MKKLLIKLIELYQVTPLHTHSMCRFTPTCSEYALEAVERYGAIRGGFMAVCRILRCNPFCKGGYDPVPRK